MAEDIDFKYPMKRACTSEIGKFCAGIPHGHANIIRCLQVPPRACWWCFHRVAARFGRLQCS